MIDYIDRFVICDTNLDLTGKTVGVTNPCQVKWFDRFLPSSGRPKWTGSAWYAQLFDTVELADAAIVQIEAFGEEGYVVSCANVEPT